MKHTALLLCAFLAVYAKAEKVFKYSENGFAANLDPTQANTVYDSMILKNIYDTPFSYRYLKRPYELMPLTASALTGTASLRPARLPSAAPPAAASSPA